jgi:Flp pilus assembly protein TadG
VTAATTPRRRLGVQWGRERGGERGGSASVEAAIALIALIALLTFGLAVGRLTAAEAAVTEAAHAAARLGSAVRDPAAARGQATTEADRVLGEQGIACAELTVTVDVPVTPIGQPSTATAQVRCAVRWADLALPGLPGRHDVSAVFTSSIDRYRERP